MGFIESIFSFIIDIFGVVGSYAVKFLPLSPVQNYISYISSVPYLGYINWFCPVGTCVSIMEAWLVCVGLWYLYSAMLRWIKAAS